MCARRDYVKKIAVYKDKLAVQLSSKVVIYELANPDDPFDMHYQSATKIQQKLDCNLLVVTSSSVILCQVRVPARGVRSVRICSFNVSADRACVSAGCVCLCACACVDARAWMHMWMCAYVCAKTCCTVIHARATDAQAPPEKGSALVHNA